MRALFLLLALHAVAGLILAKPSSSSFTTGMLRTREVSLSFLVIAVGLMVAGFVFDLTSASGSRAPCLEEVRLLRAARWLSVLAAAFLISVYYKLGMLPWQLDLVKIGQMRYIQGVEEWLINRAMDVLTITVPLLLVFGRKERLYAFLGLFALLITLKRAPLFTVVAVPLLTYVIRSGKIRPFVAAAALGIVVYASSQLLFLGLLNRDFEPSEAYAAMASGLPEVRDFGFILGLNEGRLHWGSTLIQPFLPIPSFSTSWVQNHSLRRVTTNLIGLDPEETGGLRITLAGEGYLNFGIFGAIIVCGLWGWAMRKVSNSIAAASRSQDSAAAFVVALVLCWLAFWIYLAGSSSSGAIKSGLVIMLVLLLVCRNTREVLSPA